MIRTGGTMKLRHSMSAAAALMLLGATFAQDTAAACAHCGSVADVRTIRQQGEGTGLGAVLGGVAGGATVAGAAGGAYAGHQIEKSQRSTTKHQVVVKMESGATRYFNFSNPPAFRPGDKVKIVDKRLVRR
jgi:outer membrane lipoprotein SlyB